MEENSQGDEANNPRETFAIKDSALIAIATGRRAHDLREFRDHLFAVEPDSIYYHFWGHLLRPNFESPDFNNDFAVWAKHALHDLTLAERLGVLDPTDFENLDALRAAVIDIVEERIDECENLPYARRGDSFHFIRGQLVIFDTLSRAECPEDLVDLVPRLSLGSVFYHIIEARYRKPRRLNDFAVWIRDRGERYEALEKELEGIDPYFISLQSLRTRVADTLRKHLGEGGAK
ncbi:MAG: hypothetical protein KDH09_12725 [Chrysiogenetes bacterium]|nr:hypothetical protein [Chrysiogenetes bacterium]